MSEEKLLTVRDVASSLGISEREVVELAETGALPAYKVGGVYLRFKKEQVQDFKSRTRPHSSKPKVSGEYPLRDRLGDFLYFNDFYIFSAAVIIFLLIVISRGC